MGFDGSTTILGINATALIFVISLFCLIWILMHIGQQKQWPFSDKYGKLGIFEGGNYF